MAVWGIMGDDGRFYPNGVGYPGDAAQTTNWQALQNMPIAQMQPSSVDYDVWAAQQYQNPANYDDAGNYYGPPLRQSYYQPRRVGYGVESMYNYAPSGYLPPGAPYQGPSYGPPVYTQGNVVYGGYTPYANTRANVAQIGPRVSASQTFVPNETQRANLANIGVYYDPETGVFNYGNEQAAAAEAAIQAASDSSRKLSAPAASRKPSAPAASRKPSAPAASSKPSAPAPAPAPAPSSVKEEQPVQANVESEPGVWQQLGPPFSTYREIFQNPESVDSLTYYAERSPLAKRIFNALLLPPSEQR